MSKEETMLKRLIKQTVEEEVERLVPPEIVVLLDDISRGVKQVVKKLEAQVPEGFKDEVEFSVEGKNPVALEPKRTKPPYHRATIFNDGPDSVYVFMNDIPPEAYWKAPLNQGDKLDIDTTEAKIQAIFVACGASVQRASGRVHLLK